MDYFQVLSLDEEFPFPDSMQMGYFQVLEFPEWLEKLLALSERL